MGAAVVGSTPRDIYDVAWLVARRGGRARGHCSGATSDGDAAKEVARGGGRVYPATSRSVSGQHVQPLCLGWIFTARAAETSRVCGWSHGFLRGVIDPPIQ